MKSPHRMLLSRRALVILFGLFCGGFAVLFALVQFVPASRSYQVRAEFDNLPSDDERLRQWLLEQPGIVANTCRVQRKGNTLTVGFIQVRNMLGQPAFPNLEEACERFGYRGRNPRFVDYREG